MQNRFQVVHQILFVEMDQILTHLGLYHFSDAGAQRRPQIAEHLRRSNDDYVVVRLALVFP